MGKVLEFDQAFKVKFSKISNLNLLHLFVSFTKMNEYHFSHKYTQYIINLKCNGV